MLAILPLLVASALAAPAVEKPVPVSDNTLPFTAKIHDSRRQQAKLAALDRLRKSYTGKSVPSKRAGPTVGSLTLSPGGVDYAVPITIGNQNFLVSIDTGSSDLWVASTNFQCQDFTGDSLPQEDCFPAGVPLYDPSQHPNFQPLPFKSNFNVTYGTGNAVGYAGRETVTLGSLRVPYTEFGVATSGDAGDGISSGLLGLAAPSLTSVYFGSDPSQDTNSKNLAPYPPWFYTAVAEFQVAPYFSVLLQRPTLAQEKAGATPSNFGSLTLGGRPNVPLTSTSVTVQNPSVRTAIDGVTTYQPQFYQVQVDSVNFKGNNGLNTKIPNVILDSGTTLIYLPNDIVTAFYANYPGGSFYDDINEVYVVDCNPPQGAPSLSFTIAGKAFTVTASDLIYPYPIQPPPGFPAKCSGSLMPGGSDQNDIFILGDKFLVNVLTTYNILSSQIIITQRQPY